MFLTGLGRRPLRNRGKWCNLYFAERVGALDGKNIQAAPIRTLYDLAGAHGREPAGVSPRAIWKCFELS